MDLKNVNVEEIVKQVLLNMEAKGNGAHVCDGSCKNGGGCHGKKAAGGEIPKTARVAMLTALDQRVPDS